MRDTSPPTVQLNHGRKSICAEDNSPAFLRWLGIANAWCQKHKTEPSPDYHPVTNPGLGSQVNTKASPASLSSRLPYYRESEQKVEDWPKATPDGVELSDNGIFWALLTVQKSPSSRWSKDFDWSGRLNYNRTPRGPAIVFDHQGWWVPVVGRFYALVGEGTDHGWLVNPEYPYNGLKTWEDQDSIWLGLVVPSDEILKNAIVYTMSDIPQDLRANIRIARYGSDLSLWLQGSSLARLSDARKARAESAGTSYANIILPNNITLWTLTGNENDCSFKTKTYYVVQKNTVRIKQKIAGDEDDGPIDTMDDNAGEGSSTSLYDRVEMDRLAPLLDPKFRVFLPMIADVRQTKQLVTESAQKYSKAKADMADAMHDLEPNDQAKLLNFAGMTNDDLMDT